MYNTTWRNLYEKRKKTRKKLRYNNSDVTALDVRALTLVIIDKLLCLTKFVKGIEFKKELSLTKFLKI